MIPSRRASTNTGAGEILAPCKLQIDLGRRRSFREGPSHQHPAPTVAHAREPHPLRALAPPPAATPPPTAPTTIRCAALPPFSAEEKRKAHRIHSPHIAYRQRRTSVRLPAATGSRAVRPPQLLVTHQHPSNRRRHSAAHGSSSATPSRGPARRSRRGGASRNGERRNGKRPAGRTANVAAPIGERRRVMAAGARRARASSPAINIPGDHPPVTRQIGRAHV